MKIQVVLHLTRTTGALREDRRTVLYVKCLAELCLKWDRCGEKVAKEIKAHFMFNNFITGNEMMW